MKNYVLKSNFKQDINNFLNLKHSSGYKYTTGQILIEQFDNLCFSKYSNETTLTKNIALEWAIPRNNESVSSLENRIVIVREFAKYLNNLGKSAFVIPTSYIPKKDKYKSYIYSNAEIKKIFDVIDNRKYSCYHKNTYIVLPVLFRILYCCGLRISEALSLKVKHIDLENGIISVYEAKNNIFNNTVAMKVIKKDPYNELDEEEIRNEIDILKKLSHPNIVKIYEFYISKSHYYIITEFCKEGELFSYIKNKYSENQLAVLFYQVFSGLWYLHDNKILHRDI